MTKAELAALAPTRAESRTDRGFRVIDKHGDDHNFRGLQWSYSVHAASLSVWQGDKPFTNFPLSGVRSVRPL